MHVHIYNPPRSAGGLPVTRNMPYSQSSMPSQSQPRNMTGIYLGLDDVSAHWLASRATPHQSDHHSREGNIKPPRPKTGIPPLARIRGSTRLRTPTEEQRYRKVELLRIKEEKRGFSGNPVKRHQQPSTSHTDSASAVSSQTASPLSTTYPASSSDGQLQGVGSDHFQSRRWGPGKRIDPGNLDDLLRPNPRNYTTVANSGVTRSEKLTGWLGGLPPADVHSDLGGTGMAREVGRVTNDDLAGLEECFRKVCKGNVEVLYSLLPGRKAQPAKRENTGFTVRSYRNPNQAEILADFSTRGAANSRTDRPKTVPIRRPIVPQPYFYRHYSTHPGAASIASQRIYRSSMTHADDASSNYFSSTSRILASPGAGSISRTLTQRLQSAVTVNPTPSATHGDLPRHPTSPTEDPDKTSAKAFQSGESSSRTVQESEDSSLIGASQGAAGGISAGEARNPEAAVPVAVVPSGRLLDTTTDSNTTVDSITPRPPPDSTATSEYTPRPASDSADITPRAQGEQQQQAHLQQEDTGIITMDNNNEGSGDQPVAEVKVYDDEDQTPSTTEDQKPRPKLTASNSGADIMLGLETDEGHSAEVEIDTADQEELLPEAEAPKGRVRKASITEKVIKTKASEAMAAMIKEEAESRQREFEKLLDEHAELVQEISRTPSSENLIQGERDH